MIKNYTSTVPVERTVARIEHGLAQAGAIGITKEYDSGHLKAIGFTVRPDMSGGRPITIRLPANVAAVYGIMSKTKRRPRSGTEQRILQQAERTAWKLMQDWCEVQLSLIAMQQAEFLQVFLPYVWDGRQTFFAALKERKFMELPERCK